MAEPICNWEEWERNTRIAYYKEQMERWDAPEPPNAYDRVLWTVNCNAWVTAQRARLEREQDHATTD